jgi:hypothetical protein
MGKILPHLDSHQLMTKQRIGNADGGCQENLTKG